MTLDEQIACLRSILDRLPPIYFTFPDRNGLEAAIKTLEDLNLRQSEEAVGIYDNNDD